MEMTGAEVLVRSLAAAGVSQVFMKGHEDLAPVAQSLAGTGEVRWIEPVSETSCVPMADGAARFTGRPTAAISAGDGHLLNQVVGVASAWADKYPVISIGVKALASRPTSPIFDRTGWDPEAVFTAVCRYTATIERWEQIGPLVQRAVRESLSGRQGPAHLEVVRGLLSEVREVSEAEQASWFRPLLAAQVGSPPQGDPALVARALELLKQSSRPLILAGAGVSKGEAVAEVNELARRLGAPLTSTMGGMGASLPDNPCHLGPPSYLAGEAFHEAIAKADVVLALGACFSGLDGLGLPPIWSGKIKFIQVNVAAEDIAINPRAEVAIVGDVKQVTKQMLELLGDAAPRAEVGSWLEGLRKLNQQHRARIDDEAGRPWPIIHPGAVPPLLYDIAGADDTVVVLDGGNTCLWVGMLIPVPGPRRGFFPMGMGTLGLGLPSAIAIKASAPELPVMLVTGDGALLYNFHEIETLKRYGLDLTIVVINDSAWNMIRSGQAMTSPVYGTDLPSQDYAEAARSYGIESRRITKLEEVAPAFREAFKSGRTWLLDIVTDPDSLPDSLVSFGRVEFAGAVMPPGKLLGALKPGRSKVDVRLLNLIKFIWKTV